jgi:hypothetical protein
MNYGMFLLISNCSSIALRNAYHSRAVEHFALYKSYYLFYPQIFYFPLMQCSRFNVRRQPWLSVDNSRGYRRRCGYLSLPCQQWRRKCVGRDTCRCGGESVSSWKQHLQRPVLLFESRRVLRQRRSPV